MNDPAAVYVVGVDAGATRSRALLSAPNRKDVALVEGPGFNLRRQRVKELLDFVDDAIQRLIPRDRRMDIRVRAIAVGAAGIGTPEERDEVREILHSAFINTHIFVQHDAFIAQYGAFEGEPGVLVTAGTGSIAYGRNADGREARAGGWGWLLGDEGSGWWIAHNAVRAALAEWEGSGPATAVTGLLQERFRLKDTYSLIPRMYGDEIKRSQLIELGEQFAELARGGDEVMQRIYRNAGAELAGLALRCARALEIPAAELQLALLGGVATGARDLIEPGLIEVLELETGGGTAQTPVLVEAQMDAVHGAVEWARTTLVKRSYA